MEFRVNNFKSQVAYDEATTNKIELPNAGFLAGMMLKIGEKTYSSDTAADKATIPQLISKIEVIGNGHEIIMSATGIEVLARYARRHGQMPYMELYMGLSKYTYVAFPIFFGRHVKDKEFGLDLGKWKTVDLKITDEFTVDTHFTDGEYKISLDLIFLDGANAPRGYMKFTELKYYTTTSGETEDIDIPKGRMIDNIMVLCDTAYSATGKESSNSAYNYIRNIKLVTQNNKKVLYDELIRHYMWTEAMEKGGVYFTDGVFYGEGGYAAETFLGEIMTMALTPGVSSHTVIPYRESIDSHWNKQAISKDTAAQYVQWMARGVMPFNSIMLDFNEDGGMKDMLDTIKEDPVQLKILSNASSGTNRICITEFIPY